MPCNYGWIENRTMTFEETKLASKKLLTEALVALGFVVTDDPDGLVASSRGGSFLLRKMAEGYKVEIDQRTLARLDSRQADKFIVALRKAYGEAFVKSYVKKLNGKATRTQTADGGTRVVIGF